MLYIYIYNYSWMKKPTRSDSYPNPLSLTEFLALNPLNTS